MYTLRFSWRWRAIAKPRLMFGKVFSRGKNSRFGQYNLVGRSPPLETPSSSDRGSEARSHCENGGETLESVRKEGVAEEALNEESRGTGVGKVAPASWSVDGVAGVEGVEDIGWESQPGYELRRIEGLSASTRTRKENQDAYGVHGLFSGDPEQLFLSVFDGHGMHGGKIARISRDLIPNIVATHYMVDVGSLEVTVGKIQRERVRVLKNAFSEAEKRLGMEELGVDHSFSGCAAVCLWLLGRDAYCAWTGDSRCVIGRKQHGAEGATRMFKAVELSYDHKPIRPDEKKRVMSAGGRVLHWQKESGPLRVWLPDDWIPGLAMTRSIGDTRLSEYGVVSVPEVTHTLLSEKDSFLILASDGVWEVMTTEQVVSIVGELRMQNIKACDAAKFLVREAVRLWRRNERIVDDTTVIIVWLDMRRESEETGGSGFHPEGSLLSRRRLFAKAEPQLLDDRGTFSLFTPRNMEE